MSRWTHILSLWLGNEISSALQNRSKRNQPQYDPATEIEDLKYALAEANKDTLEMAAWVDEDAAAYQAQISELDNEIARLRRQVAALEDELETLRDGGE